MKPVDPEYYSQTERINIIKEIIIKLKNYVGKDSTVLNLYSDQYSYYSEFRKITNDYIHNQKTYSGILDFVEIGKKMEYYLPIRKKNIPKFIILINSNC